jgi:hypothetical protein
MNPKYRTRTREFGKVTFHAPFATERESGYVWIEGENLDRQQIMYGGGLYYGNTVTSYSDELAEVCRRWMRDRRRGIRLAGDDYE